MTRTHAMAIRPAALLLVIGALSACGSTAPGGAAPATSASPSGSDALIHAALTDLESALGEQGRGPFKDTFGTLQMDAQGGHVVLFATDDARARALIGAAAAAHPGIETGWTVIRHSAYARATVDPAIERIGNAALAQSLPLPVYSAGLASDASGIKITTTKEGTTSMELSAAIRKLSDGIPVVFIEGAPIKNFDGTAEMVPPSAWPTHA
ncbi:hypothetical protein [Kitasatospora sp. A2-31]|uniref:hypothetical protein n=1 Tax=Kitasatospora sp. A2-31 TaxID=2916414 RepID=UPI001EEF4A58|nr:hypothetical protein [Kitasatospora sp. A2-31]MCG6499636.1 hypothetical protein [Kitasatospora sp. A2-31]